MRKSSRGHRNLHGIEISSRGSVFPQVVDYFPGVTENPHEVEISSDGSIFPQAIDIFPGVTENPHEVDIPSDGSIFLSAQPQAGRLRLYDFFSQDGETES